MSERDVGFTLRLIRDPTARRTLDQWERDLIGADERTRKAKAENAKKLAADVARINREALRADQAAQARHNRSKSQDDAQYTREKKERARRHNDDLNRIRGQARQAELRANAQAEADAKASLARRLAVFKATKAAEAKAAIAAAAAEKAAKELAYAQSARGQAGAFLSSTAMTYGASMLGVGSAYMLGKKAISTASNVESQKAQLEALTGDQQKAKAMYLELQALSVKTGVSIAAFSQAATTMDGFGVSIDEIMPKLRQTAILSRGNTDRMQRLALAYSQAAGQGRFMSEELNQMIDAGFNPLLAISNRTGKSIQELRKEMQKGTFDIGLLAQGFADAAGEGSKGALLMDKLGETAERAAGRANIAWEKFFATWGEKAQGLRKMWNVTSQGIAEGLTPSADDVQASRVSGFSKLTDVQLRARIAGKGNATGRAASESRSVISSTYDELLRRSTKRLEEQAKIEEEAAEKKKQADADREARIKAYNEQLKLGDAKQLENAHEINKIRLTGAKKELEVRQQLLVKARETTQEALKGFQTTAERFGAMSSTEQDKAVQLVVKARKNTSNLTPEEISTLQGLGTKESKALASKALLNRAQAGFGEDPLNNRARAIEDQIAEVQKRRRALIRSAPTRYQSLEVNGEERRVPAGIRITRQAQQELENLKQREASLRMRGQDTYEQIEQRRRVRSSLFEEERGGVRQAMLSQSRVEANVQQTINFVAHYNQTSQEIANKVIDAYNQANVEKTKEIVKLLEPIRKEIFQLQQRQAANFPGRGI